jgi:hypothetical protein
MLRFLAHLQSTGFIRGQACRIMSKSQRAERARVSKSYHISTLHYPDAESHAPLSSCRHGLLASRWWGNASQLATLFQLDCGKQTVISHVDLDLRASWLHSFPV